MRLKSIQLKNFCRFYGHETIHFQPGMTFIVSENRDEPDEFENNGVGKTAILHAISYALFGKTPGKKALVGHDLISHQCGPKGVMEVHLEFEGGVTVQRVYQLHRRRSHVTFTTPGKVHDDDPSVVTEKIAEFFNCSHLLFSSSLCMSQRDSTSTQFLGAEPSERSKVLSDLVDDRVWQTAGKLLAADAKAVDAQVKSAEASLAVHRRNLQQLESRLQHLSTTLATAARVEDERREKLVTRRDQLKAILAKETAIEVDEPALDLKKIEERRILWSKKLETVNNELRELQLPAPPLPYGTNCPTCGEPAKAERVEQVLALREKITKQREQLKNDAKEATRALEACQMAQQKYRDWKARTELARSRREQYMTELAHVEEDLQAKPVSLFALAEEESKLKQQVYQQKQEIDAVVDEFELQSKALTVMQRLSRGFTGEMRNLLFDRIRGDLDVYTQAYLQNLAGRQLQVEYPSGDGARERFDIFVYNEQARAQKLEAYSGGEYWRVALSILFALRDVLMLKSKCRLPLLCVDDPVGPVDPVGLTNLFSTLQGFVDSGSAETILVTVPDSSLATTGNVVKIIREGGISRLA